MITRILSIGAIIVTFSACSTPRNEHEAATTKTSTTATATATATATIPASHD